MTDDQETTLVAAWQGFLDVMVAGSPAAAGDEWVSRREEARERLRDATNGVPREKWPAGVAGVI